MEITSIKQQIKNARRYSIFVDGRYAFSLSADALIESGLTQGRELSRDELAAYKKASQEDKAYNLTLAYVARRMRSEGELYEYFRRRQYADELIVIIMNKLRKLGFVDDAEFARRWVENRRLLKGTSLKKLRLELRQKRVSDEIIQATLSADENNELELLRDLTIKKRKQSRYQDDQKLIAYLARQGFNYSDIKIVLGKENSY